MKKIWMAMLIVAAAACSSGTIDKEEALRKQISDHKAEVKELNEKIAGLEAELRDIAGEASTFNIPVRAKTLAPETFHHFFKVRGAVEAINESFISAEVSGRIISINVKEGEWVKKGQVLARLDSEITSNSINELEAQLEYAETVYQKQKRLWEKKIGSELQYLNAKSNRDNLANRLETLKAQQAMAFIKAPIDGVIDEIFMKNGELAMPGRELIRLVNLSELYINAEVSESYLASIKTGDLVEVTFPVYPDIRLEVPVFRIGNVIDPGNRTFKLQLKISNIDNRLKPNILSVITINDFSSDTALVVPSKVIKQDMNGYYLYVAKQADNKMASKKVYIETGMSQDDLTMVASGVAPGDKVIIEGFNQVSDGSPVVIR